MDLAIFSCFVTTPPNAFSCFVEETVWNPKSFSFSWVNGERLWNASPTKSLQHTKLPPQDITAYSTWIIFLKAISFQYLTDKHISVNLRNHGITYTFSYIAELKSINISYHWSSGQTEYRNCEKVAQKSSY